MLSDFSKNKILKLFCQTSNDRDITGICDVCCSDLSDDAGMCERAGVHQQPVSANVQEQPDLPRAPVLPQWHLSAGGALSRAR